MARKLLTGAEIVRNWTSVAGALHGILRYLGMDVDQAFVMGTSGHAFRLAIAESDEGIASSFSPIALDYGRALELYAGLGYTWEAIPARPEDREAPKARDWAIARIRRSIDRGRPAAVFGLHLGEF